MGKDEGRGGWTMGEGEETESGMTGAELFLTTSDLPLEIYYNFVFISLILLFNKKS